MPAKSPEQQRLFGMALAYKRGEFDGEPSDKVKELSKLPEKTLLKYAKTKHSEIEETLSFDEWLIINELEATTTNVIGMGNATPATPDSIGSADVFGSIMNLANDFEDDEDDEDD